MKQEETNDSNNDSGRPAAVGKDDKATTTTAVTTTLRTPKQEASRRRGDKENKTPPPALSESSSSSSGLDWRQPHTAPPPIPKTNGISPKQFHSSNNKGIIRSRPGETFVKHVHAESQENALRQGKKEVIKHQQIQRSAFKEVTSLNTWPLQKLALEEYQGLLQVYLDQADAAKDKKHGSAVVLPEHQYGDSSSSCNSTDKKRIMKDKAMSPAKSQLKNKYRQDFLLERRIPAHNAVVTPFSAADPCGGGKLLFDAGLWSMEPRVFSVEKANGKRKYLVGHLGRVLDFMWRKTDRCNRHFYEMILEQTPCRLYFDLEFEKKDNPDISTTDGGDDSLMDEFYEELIQELKDSFPSQHTKGLDRTCIVDLDSSTPQKFSRHLIVHFPSQALFENCQQAGKFVKRFVQRLADEVATEQLKERRPHLHDYMFVNPKGTLKDDGSDTNTAATIPLSKKTCFVDLGVYTRNRLFRLMGSSKFGKNPSCALRLAENNQFPVPEGFGNELFYVPAMVKSQSQSDHAIGSDSSDNDEEDEHENGDEALKKFKALTDWSLHAQALCSTLVVPMNGPKIDYPILPEILDGAVNGDGKTISDHFSSALSSSTTTTTNAKKAPRKTFASLGTSPYPYIDDFILKELANRGGILGSIRSWTLDYGPDDSENKNHIPVGIAFQMSRNRWCECVQRSHKSNNILWNVNFRTKQCVQSCFDPDCRAMNFRGTPVDLPFEVVQELKDALFDEAVAQMDESEWLATSKPAVKKARENQNKVGELENAMMGLNIETPNIKQESKSLTGSNPTKSETVGDPLSDDALWGAIQANPELFP